MLADSLSLALNLALHPALNLDVAALAALGAPIAATSATPATAATPGLAGLATGWLLILFVLGSASVFPAVLAAILRRRLPPDPRLETPLESVVFGHSPRALRAPRHAISSHRSLLTSVCVIGLGLVLIAYAAAGRSLGGGGLVAAVLFTLPTLLVALHARRRTGPSMPPPRSETP